MDEANILHQAAQSLMLVLFLSLPVILAATVAGLLVGLFQALTQIQEQALPHGFKLIAVVVAIMFTARWLGTELHSFAIAIFNTIATIGP